MTRVSNGIETHRNDLDYYEYISSAGEIDGYYYEKNIYLNDATITDVTLGVGGISGEQSRYKNGVLVSQTPITSGNASSYGVKFKGGGDQSTANNPATLSASPAPADAKEDIQKPEVPTASGYWNGVGQVAKGYFINAPINAVKGMAQAVMHPIETAKGLGNAAMHPIQTTKAIAGAIYEKAGTLEGQGELAFDIVTIAAGGAYTKAKLCPKGGGKAVQAESKLAGHIDDVAESAGINMQRAGSYRPPGKLPWENGAPKPSSNTPHTRLGTGGGGKPGYTQAIEFGENGVPLKAIDFSGHHNHPNPHQHLFDPITGKRNPHAEPFIPPTINK